MNPSGGSLTALPIIETQEGEVSAYIPTNVISITDGQIYLEPNLFFSGIRPAINVGISVSRVGGNGPDEGHEVGRRLACDSTSRPTGTSRRSPSSEPSSTRSRSASSSVASAWSSSSKQGQFQPLPFEDQVMIIFAANEGFLDDIAPAKVQDFEKKFLHYVKAGHADVGKTIRTSKSLSDDTKKSLKATLTDFATLFKAGKVPDAAPAVVAKK